MTIRCYEAGCISTDVRRCFFCPNVCCTEHGTIDASGTICSECSAREQQKQEQRAAAVAQAQQAAAKTSGCLVAMVALLCWLVTFVIPTRRALGRHRAP